jgi:hypothetical protein
MERARTAGLTVYACTMGNGTRNVHLDASTTLVTIELSGTASAYITFLNNLAQMPQIVTCEQMHIEYGNTEQLRATCVLGFVKINA